MVTPKMASKVVAEKTMMIMVEILTISLLTVVLREYPILHY